MIKNMNNNNNTDPSLNGYICFFKNKKLEVYAKTTIEARDKAASIFKAKKAYEVTAVLAEKGGEPVVHTAVN